ncbi:hypothetical protein HETIRDRAFT_425984 [Heterobasidion irregulare TC 32-1]|uniref:Ubiquitin-like domain-containing protein n=1 Tax=Heterobasidion irregulare (strain TC 32-1) TaxID=747525 RepID=W4KHG4_HETIT|nr:uncharacterized protein HETIRDRAFT_425984 [Heterobasidion irregulare TC 32-1]ETW84765.1 hypothetical protein HETIRDRAFT_425984 [Heterobasidion irregulare TC 32-1]
MTSLPPYSAKDIPATADIVVFKGSKNGSGDAKVTLRGLPRPVKYEDVAAELVRQGAFGAVGTSATTDQPLLHFYNKVFLPVGAGGALESPPSYDTSEARLTHNGQIAQVNGVNVRFHRTISVPALVSVHPAPLASLPHQSLFPSNVGSATGTLPKSVLSKGGAFLSVYQREAIPKESYVVKISVGGVNALTGVPQNASSCRKQDYLPVGGEGGQLQVLRSSSLSYSTHAAMHQLRWLDGISTAPGVVRQFVAMHLGKGYTVEGQVTEAEYHALERLMKVQRTRGISRRQSNSQARGVHGTATFQQHDVLAVASSANTADNVIIATLPFRTHLDHKPRAHAKLSQALVQVERRASAFKLDAGGVSRITGGDAFVVDCEKSDTIEHLKTKIEDLQGISSQFQRLIHAGKQLRDGLTIPTMGSSLTRPSIWFCAWWAADLGQRSRTCWLALRQAERYRKRSTAIRCPPSPTMSRVQTFHVAVINAACFTAVTGLPSPPSPITAQTYLKYDLPWFELYDEHIPAANNASAATLLGDVKSIAQLDRDRAAAGGKDDVVQTPCAHSVRELATHRLSPCGHVFCNACSRAPAARPPRVRRATQPSYSRGLRVRMRKIDHIYCWISSFEARSHKSWPGSFPSRWGGGRGVGKKMNLVVIRKGPVSVIATELDKNSTSRVFERHKVGWRQLKLKLKLEPSLGFNLIRPGSETPIYTERLSSAIGQQQREGPITISKETGLTEYQKEAADGAKPARSDFREFIKVEVYPTEMTDGTREILTRSVNGVIARRSLKQKRERSHRVIARP